MKKNIQELKSMLQFNYQKDIYERIGDAFDVSDAEKLDCFSRLLFNLFVNSDISSNSILRQIVNNFHYSDFNKNDSLQWGIMRNIFFIKFFYTEDIHEKHEILKILLTDINDNKILVEKRIRKVQSGVNIILIENKLKDIVKSDINQLYAWKIELLKMMMENNIYEYINKVESFIVRDQVKDLILELHKISYKINSLEG